MKRDVLTDRIHIEINSKVKVLLDKTLGKYNVVYAAAGTAFSAVPVSLSQLQAITGWRIVDLE